MAAPSSRLGQLRGVDTDERSEWDEEGQLSRLRQDRIGFKNVQSAPEMCVSIQRSECAALQM